jgi:protoheme IX farnesyltransferase
MSTSALSLTQRRAGLLGRLGDYVELTKPRISVLVLVTVAISAYVGRWGSLDAFLMLHALVGTALVAASASALNQWLERRTDRLMPRTLDRPLPAGRLSAGEVLAFGAVSIALGTAYLAWLVNVETALLGIVTWALYVWVYTPLKRQTTANTTIGAVAGAMPVLMGFAAAGAPLGLEAATLFLIVYLWQFPHFMAIAWLYRRDYEHAGLRMLTVVDPTGRRAGAQALLSALALLPVSVLPVALELGGSVYFAGALLLGVAQLAIAGRFLRRLDEASARDLLRASLVYLPVLWFLLMLAQVT